MHAARLEGATTVTKAAVASVDDYIGAQPAAVRPILQRVRSVIRKALPAAEETISYKIPTYKLRGSAVVHFAGWKEFYSIYPLNDRVAASLKGDLAGFEVKKSTLHLSFSRPVPAKLIERIVKLLAKEVAPVKSI
jgi:uncharacterized protein YdhG (YjbR/CyaY superfamily)